MTCAWIETSSAETGSSATMKLRLQRQRAGDGDALALTAGEFVRVVAHLRRPQADALEQGGDALGRAPCRLRCRARFSGSPTISPAGHARIERRERILEDDLHLPAERAQLRLRRGA